MSGTYPLTPPPARLTLRSDHPSLVSVTHSLARQVRTRNAQRWGFDIEYGPRSWAEIAPVLGFLSGQRGRAETFSFTPWREYTRGTTSTWAVPRVDGAGQSGTTLITDGWCTVGIDCYSDSFAVTAGDFLRIENANKVYQVVADAKPGVFSSRATITLNTPLVASPADNARIYVHRQSAPISWTCSLEDDGYQVTVTPGGRYQLTVRLVEVP